MIALNRLAAAVAATAVLLCGPAAPALAAPHWNKNIECKQTDPDGRVIPTRIGNHALGWSHFSGKHNIRKCKVVDAAIAGKVDKKTGGRLEYWGNALRGRSVLKIVVVVQYTRKTSDGRYNAGAGQKMGVITAYCKGMNKCPNWLNE
ncbi:hypothetical protein [Streptomyces gelaticus]|uniref:hypothetical protein n=1 Tax=Streptomyces gelaticus TaxID=285446 RepID=UPI001E3541F2|nr:hypothetical protein [Streptomyces gelaticus]